MKSKRQQKILELIETYDINTQEELISRLNEAGYVATQATISRDIRELKLVKAMMVDGVYKYVHPTKRETPAPRFNSALAESVLRIDSAGNAIVIRTYPGMAQPVASCIDAIGNADILGCVGGDDTIIVVIRSAEKAGEMCNKIRQMLNTL
ncbi:MAG: arginine repressor [Clostridia bacterium]|nr:arginine repressor [Clostridia bacterium]